MRAHAFGRVGVEMSADPAFLGRVRRLAAVSAIDLGLLWALAVATLDEGHGAIRLALLAGWLTMPTVLAASLWRPAVRLLVAVPAVLVGGALIAICLTALPPNGAARAGWLTTTAGILFGGFLGSWFWYRWLPVPASLRNPFSRARLGLIAAHVTLVVVGQILVALAKWV
ncbi:MAG: hypothetical protein ABUS79_00625 [Pseudomonadota bacterium]